MTLPTGKPISAGDGSRADAARARTGTKPLWAEPCAAFTLIELILVMAMLVIMVSISAPALARFFRGRTLDAEAKRFLALTRYGQSRAVSEGVPAVLWIDAKEGAYGLRADSSYVEQDTKALEYRLHEDIQVEIEFTVVTQRLTTVWRGTSGLAANVPRIRFLPDGFVGQNSPARVVFRQGEDGEISIGPGRNGLNYEIETNQVERLRR